MDAIAPHFNPAKAPLPAALKEELVSRKLHLSPSLSIAGNLYHFHFNDRNREEYHRGFTCVEETIQLARILASRGPLTHEKGSISLETGLGQKNLRAFLVANFCPTPPFRAQSPMCGCDSPVCRKRAGVTVASMTSR